MHINWNAYNIKELIVRVNNLHVYDLIAIYFVPELKTPTLVNESIILIDDEHCNVTIKWNSTSDPDYDDIEYVVSISNSSEFTNKTFTTTVVNITLDRNVHYSMMVTSLRCDGDLKSNSSNILTVLCQGIIFL